MTAFTRRQALQMAVGSLALASTSAWANPSQNLEKEVSRKSYKLICVEEHLLDRELVQVSTPHILPNAPYLPNWGKRVTDGQNPDRSRPQVISAQDSLRKSFDLETERLTDMDQANIAMQILSYGGASQFAPADQSADLDRKANDRLAQTIAKHPTRFAGFATLPWAKPDLAIKELERSVKELGLKGALLNGRPSEHFLDHPQYAELLSAFNELKVPLFLHPGIPLPAVQQAYYSGFNDELTARLSMFGWGWHNEAGVQLLRLILSGVFDRNPNLNVISGHWGEMLPFYLQRLDDSIPLEASGLNRTITQTFKDQVYVTPSGMLTMPHFQFIYELMGAEKILYSIDYPYQSLDGAMAFIQNLPISEQEKELIAHGNAERLLGL